MVPASSTRVAATCVKSPKERLRIHGEWAEWSARAQASTASAVSRPGDNRRLEESGPWLARRRTRRGRVAAGWQAERVGCRRWPLQDCAIRRDRESSAGTDMTSGRHTAAEAPWVLDGTDRVRLWSLFCHSISSVPKLNTLSPLPRPRRHTLLARRSSSVADRPTHWHLPPAVCTGLGLVFTSFLLDFSVRACVPDKVFSGAQVLC
ncbi:hypothetical protein BD310DRAFT_325257 [Dichomitus squalens]|uniref:Uncharacterized protein n=1 Tax=Dichomitus squalens TaxID=114155 RepID=A0A4Q9PAF0_9APHY|nr:hypothetical protein BD310DRAFT_325257 [Dichomitus squalens]